jgi:hypothetical protein
MIKNELYREFNSDHPVRNNYTELLQLPLNVNIALNECIYFVLEMWNLLALKFFSICKNCWINRCVWLDRGRTVINSEMFRRPDWIQSDLKLNERKDPFLNKSWKVKGDNRVVSLQKYKAMKNYRHGSIKTTVCPGQHMILSHLFIYFFKEKT